MSQSIPELPVDGSSAGSLPQLSEQLIYKLVAMPEWLAAAEQGSYPGSADDRRDGYIHLSTAEQVAGTLARYFGKIDELLLVAVDPNAIAANLRHEPSRGGALFPHLYAALPVSLGRIVATRARADGPWQLPDA